MRDRFNRPLSPEQVESLIYKVREGAMARQQTDPAGADLMFKSLHVITMLWRECALHDNLTATAEQVLEATEARLHECLERQSIAEAAEALAEVKRLKSIIKDPPDTHKAWVEQV